jgi:hypothetical protein
MLRSLLRWTRSGLRRLPFTRRVYRAWRYYGLCHGPYRGSAAQVAARLSDLEKTVGSDRFPWGTRLADLAGWLHDLNRTPARTPPVPPRRLLFFNTMPFWVRFSVPMAVVLAGRGFSVDFVWLPHSGQDRAGTVPPPPYPGRFPGPYSFPFVRLHRRLRLCNLLHVTPSPVTDAIREASAEQGVLDARYWLRRELLDFANDPAARDARDFRTAQNLDAALRLQSLLHRGRYDTVLTANGGVYEFGMAYQVGRLNGLRAVTFDFSERKCALVASHSTPCVDYDTADLWRKDEPHVLTAEREREVMEFLSRRQRPNWTEGDYNWPGQSVAVQPAEQLKAALNLSPHRPVALLCANAAYDAAALGHERAFPSMAEWLLATVAWFARRADWQLLIRAHPVEVYHPSGEPAHELVASRFPNLPENVRIIRPGDPVNTYSLMAFANLGLVYTTSVGLEMAARGIPVIATGRVHYAGKGFTTDPPDALGYEAALERATATPEARLTPRQRELARCYADVYFCRHPKPFPWWNIAEFDKDMAAWPVQRILTGDCPAEYLRTFDYLAGLSE